MPIYELLRKFDGARVHDDIKAGRRRYRLTRLPAYLTLHMKRFTKNNFFWEKNPTIVNFPVRNLELRDILPVPTGVGHKTPWSARWWPSPAKPAPWPRCCCQSVSASARWRLHKTVLSCPMDMAGHGAICLQVQRVAGNA